MIDEILLARVDDVTIAVATQSPYFCVAGDTPAAARAAAARARAFYQTSPRPRPVSAVAVGKPDFVRPARRG